MSDIIFGIMVKVIVIKYASKDNPIDPACVNQVVLVH